MMATGDGFPGTCDATPLGERLDVDPVRPFGTTRDLIGRDPHLEEVADRGEAGSP